MVRFAPPPGPNAPSLRCSQDSRETASPVQSAFDSHGRASQRPPAPHSEVKAHICPAFAPAVQSPNAPVASLSRQKPQNTRCCVPWGSAVLDDVPVVSRNGTGRLPIRTSVLIVQSWLVGYCVSPVPPPPSGTHAMPLSKP